MITNLESGESAPAVERILSIENVAETFGISRWLLRYCEFRGIIGRRSRVGQIPTYSWADCDRIALIIKCRRAGLPLSDIVPLIRAVDHDSARVHESGLELCAALIQRLERRRRTVDEALSEIARVRALLSAKLAGDSAAGFG